jgi:hypothetical protein
MASTQRERDAEKRAVKLAEIDEQVAEGQLSIRQMTPEERERYQPKTKPAARPAGRKPKRPRA